MKQAFVEQYLKNREKAGELGVRLRPLTEENALRDAHRCLTGHRESDGFALLADKGHLELSLEALAVDKKYTALFSDEEVNTALTRLLDAGYKFCL